METMRARIRPGEEGKAMDSILKWYRLLRFPKEWDMTVAEAAARFDPARLCPNAEERTPMENLLNYLASCDILAARYEEKGIDRKILMDTLSDLVLWAKNCHTVTGGVGVTSTAWMDLHFNMEIFRLGRLQFRKGKLRVPCEPLGIPVGEPIVEVHIPQGEPLIHEDCLRSYRQAIAFFTTYFPEYSYRYFTCFSWLLGDQLREFLKPESNILKFRSDFTIFYYKESDSALRYLFELNPDKTKESGLQRKIREYKESGGKLHDGYGVIDKTRFEGSGSVGASGREDGSL